MELSSNSKEVNSISFRSSEIEKKNSRLTKQLKDRDQKIEVLTKLVMECEDKHLQYVPVKV